MSRLRNILLGLTAEVTDKANELHTKAKPFLGKATVAMKTGYERSKDIAKHNWDNRHQTMEIAKEGAVSAAHGSKTFVTGLSGTLISDSKIDEIKKDIENQGGHYRELIAGVRKKGRLQDSFILGGEIYYFSNLPVHFPEEIEAAYQAAYPLESAQVALRDKIQELGPDQIGGLISGIKGKLFEMQYVQYLNDGNLPEGYNATLAEGATQPGWDIEIRGPDSELAEVIQAKATDSVSYVQRAFDRYPEIDLVTTDEVYAQLTMRGISDGLINSGVNNADLTATVAGSLNAGEISMDFSPPLITLALIAFTSYRSTSLDAYQKARETGDRTGKAYLAYLFGGGIAVLTNTWWLGLAASVTSRFLTDSGQKKWVLYWELKRLKKLNQSVIDRYKAHGLAPA